MSTPQTRRRFSRSFLIALVLLLVLGGVAFLAFQDRRYNCGEGTRNLSDLKHLYITLRLYAGDHEGRYPEDFRAVAREYGFKNEKLLLSPSLLYIRPADSPPPSA